MGAKFTRQPGEGYKAFQARIVAEQNAARLTPRPPAKPTRKRPKQQIERRYADELSDDLGESPDY